MKRFIDFICNKEGFCYIKGASVNEIAEAESRLGVKFAEEYNEYLIKYGVASFNGHELTGICPFPRLNVVDVTREERSFSTNVSNGLYVVEDTHFDGIVVWQDERGAVYETVSGSEIEKVGETLLEYYSNCIK